LNAAGLHYKTRSSSETWSGIVLSGAHRHLRMNHGWYPPDIGAIELSKQDEEKRANKSKNPEHAIRKPTRPYQLPMASARGDQQPGSHAGPKQTTNATPSADIGTRR
jgi:hypothetical protein